MENAKKRIEQIKSMSKQLNLSSRVQEWPLREGFNFYDIRVRVQLGGVESIGAGLSTDPNISFLKAFSESIERLVCKKLNISTSGVAAHWTMNEAIEASTKELIEHDVVLSFFLAGEAVEKKNICEKKLQRLGIIVGKEKLLFLKLNNDLSTYVYVCVTPWLNGNAYGYGSSREEDEAIEKAVFECLTKKYVHEIDLSRKGDEVIEIYANKPNLAFITGKTIPELNEGVFVPRIEIEVLQRLDMFIKDSQFVVVRSSSRDLQKYYNGEVNSDQVNFTRLNRLFKKKFMFKDLNLQPHPIA